MASNESGEQDEKSLYVHLRAGSCRAGIDPMHPKKNGSHGAVVLRSTRSKRRRLVSGSLRRLNYLTFPRTTVIDPAGSEYVPSGVAAIVTFLSSAGVLQYCTRATDPTKGWLTCLSSSMTR
jgi:hypothetical protein